MAGCRSDGYYCVYETTKRSKADEYIARLTRTQNDYDKIYIISSPIADFDKRNYDWED